MLSLAIDAGGTRTRVVSVDVTDLSTLPDAQVSAHSFGPGNFRHLGEAGVRRLVDEILTRFTSLDPAGTAVLAGFAGAGTPESQALIRSALTDAGFRRVTVTSDAGLLLMALRNRGVVLIAGTGAICVGRKPHVDGAAGFTEVRAGGYGYRVPSEPGGYALGIRAVDAALRIADGRCQAPTELSDIVRRDLGLPDLQQIVPLLYPDDTAAESVQARVAGLAPRVLASADGGDPVARAIVSDIVDGMADHIRAVCRRLGLREGDVGLHGGLFAAPERDRLLIRPLRSHPRLTDLALTFRTLGLRDGDPDPLLEAMRFDLERSATT